MKKLQEKNKNLEKFSFTRKKKMMINKNRIRVKMIMSFYGNTLPKWNNSTFAVTIITFFSKLNQILFIKYLKTQREKTNNLIK
jgi:hypothetical protein